MLRTGIIILISTFTVLGGFPRGGDAQLPPAPRWIPPEAVLVLEVEEPAALLDLILAPEVLESVPSLKAYEAFTARPGFKRFLGLVRFLETRLDMDWKTAMRKLTAKGMTLAVLPRNATLLIMDAEDDVVLDKLHKAFLQVMRAGAVLEDRPDRITARKYRGVATWAWKGGGTYAVLGNRLLLTSRPEVLRSVLDVCADPDRGSLATAPAYCAARKAAAPGVAGRVFLDLERVKQNPRVAKALARNRNPIASLLFTGITEALRDSSWLALGVRVKGKTVVLDAAVDGKAVNPAEPTAFGRPPEQGGGALPNLAVPGRIAAVTLYRDLYRFYAAKDTLFPERTSELIFFENMMGIFFSGRDLTEEVLAETKAGIRVVVTEPVFDADIGVPRIKIPAFAVILRLKKPESFGVVAEEAWQKALGLINFTRGQQGQPGLIIDRLTQGDTKFTMACFSIAGIEDRTNLEDRFNFRPSIAIQGDSLILSSTDGLARDILDALKAEAGTPPALLERIDTFVEIDGKGVAAALEMNRHTLVQQNMVKEGNTREESETVIDVLVALAQAMKQSTLLFGTKGGRPHAHLTIQFHTP